MATGTVLVGDISNMLTTPAILAEAGLGGVVFHEILGFHAATPALLADEAQARAVDRDPLRIGNADAACGSVPGKQDIARPIDPGEVGKLAVVGADDGRIELQLLGGVRYPAFAEAFPCQCGDGACPKHRPHRHFECPGVGSGDDADAVAVR